MFLVDTVALSPERVDEYLGVLRSKVLPVMAEAGAALEYCRTTSAELGEPVEVQVAWSFADNRAWNDIRRTLVLDPRYYEYAAQLADLRLGGTRRFHRPVPAFDTAGSETVER